MSDRLGRGFRVLGPVFLVLLLSTGCATPARRLDHLARDLGLVPGVIQANGYRLITYRNRRTEPRDSLTIYLEGDGTPWITRRRIARDPTPRNPLALRLMALDPNPSLYLGRPCYHGQHRARGCSPWLWTQGRYSEPVVATLEAAIKHLIRRDAIERIRLVGYSGGGVLAWLLAQRIPETRVLITLGANLDIDRWTARHGYSPLVGSLNPARGDPLPSRIRQWHLVGTRDTNVPPALLEGLPAALRAGAKIRSVNTDHRCCWLGFWPQFLDSLAR